MFHSPRDLATNLTPLPKAEAYLLIKLHSNNYARYYARLKFLCAKIVSVTMVRNTGT